MIGSGVLNRENLANERKEIFNNILDKIEVIRTEAKEYYQNIAQVDKDKIVKSGKPHNFISILGARGSGKTSLMLTVLKELEESQGGGKNILLPIIDPDRFNAERDALGWIIFSFQKIVDNYIDINEKYCTYNDQMKKTKKLFNDLKEIYILSRHYYRSSITSLTEGIVEYKKQNEEIVFADMKLFDIFREFIDSLVILIKCKEPNVQPLFFITFDDIDINPEYGPRILETILTYLNHQAIVVFALGKYSTFLESLVIDFWNREKISSVLKQKDIIHNRNLLESRYQRAEEFLAKVFPPFHRNILTELKLEERLEFTPYAEKITGGSLKDLLKDITIELKNGKKITFLDLLYKVKISGVKLNDEQAKIENSDFEIREYIIRTKLMSKNNTNGDASNLEYFAHILPRFPRGLINLYYSLQKEGKIQFGNFYNDKNEYSDVKEYSNMVSQNYKKLRTIYKFMVENISDLKMIYERFNTSEVIRLETDIEKIIFDYTHIKMQNRKNFRNEFNISTKIRMSFENRDLNNLQSAFIQFLHDFSKLVLPLRNTIIIKNGVGLKDITLFKNAFLEITMVNFFLFNDYYLFMEIFKVLLPFIPRNNIVGQIKGMKKVIGYILFKIIQRNYFIQNRVQEGGFAEVILEDWNRFRISPQFEQELERAFSDTTIRKNGYNVNGVYKYNLIEFIFHCDLDVLNEEGNYAEKIRDIYNNNNISYNKTIQIFEEYAETSKNDAIKTSLQDIVKEMKKSNLEKAIEKVRNFPESKPKGNTQN